jgi:hypothetical protein
MSPLGKITDRTQQRIDNDFEGDRGARLESDGGGVDGELRCVEDEEAGGRRHRDVDGRSAGEGAGGEVGAEAKVVAERGCKAEEACLAPEIVR